VTHRIDRLMGPVALVGYVALAWLAVSRNVVMGDALSRLANASYAVRGRDPHLSAIGFVWSPLPTVGMLVPVRALGNGAAQGRWLVPAIGAALGTTGLLVGLRTVLRGAGVTRRACLLAVVVLALNPLIVFYSVNGMTETFFLLTLVFVVRGAIRFVRDDGSAALASTGLWLAVAYLVRYEAVAVAGALAAGVVLWAYWLSRQRGEGRRIALWRGVLDATTLTAPFATAFVLFAVVSWIVTGHPFEQLSSTYGNSAVVADTQGGALLGRLTIAAGQLAGLAPLAVPAAAVVVLRGTRRARETAAVASVVFGAVLAFTFLLQASGRTLPFLRFWIAALPLQVVLLACATQRTPRSPRSRDDVARPWRALGTVALGGLVVAATTTWTMRADALGEQEHQLRTLLDPTRDRRDERATLRAFQAERRLAGWLDDRRLGRGEVVIDPLLGFAVIAASTNPEQFVIPSDEDFPLVVVHPEQRGVRYLVTVPPTGRGAADALNRQYPGIHDGRTGGLVLRVQVDGEPGDPTWRVWEITGRLETKRANGPPPAG
jgi:hypothetical protein